jgi:hypothetical protein
LTPFTIIARKESADSESAIGVLVGIISRAVGERVSARDDGLITTNVEQSTITKE